MENENMSLGSDAILERIIIPEDYFRKNRADFLNTVKVVRNAFGSEMKEDDIYNHLVEPEQVYLVRKERSIVGMCSYTSIKLDSESILFIDGIAINPCTQGKGLFKKITDKVINGHKYIGLKTQSPRMHQALSSYVDEIFPNFSMQKNSKLDKIISELGQKLNLNIDNDSVIRGNYGQSLYQQEQKHNSSSKLFNQILNIDYQGGDSVLCVGLREVNK